LRVFNFLFFFLFIGNLIEKEKEKTIFGNFEFKEWRIIYKKDLSKCTSLFFLVADNISLKNNTEGVEWMGRHFVVSSLQ
jgi:hypothetical protein